MNQANYVLKFNEAALAPKKNPSPLIKLRPAILVVTGIILLSSFIFDINIFGELSIVPRVLLIGLAISTFFVNGEEKVAKLMEIWFFDDYLVLYREKHYYSKKLSRKEYDKFYYKDIKECEYRTETKRMNIYGVVEGKWYNYKVDGTVSNVPDYHKTTDSIRYFYTTFADAESLIKEIEFHSPIKIKIVNT